MIGRNKRVDRGSLFSWGPEFTAAGIGSTGIGCYFDDPVHEVFDSEAISAGVMLVGYRRLRDRCA